jgi:hypothetical protein
MLVCRAAVVSMYGAVMAKGGCVGAGNVDCPPVHPLALLCFACRCPGRLCSLLLAGLVDSTSCVRAELSTHASRVIDSIVS